MSAVGAYTWKGIYQEFPSNGLNPVSSKIDQMEPESYLGGEVTLILADFIGILKNVVLEMRL